MGLQLCPASLAGSLDSILSHRQFKIVWQLAVNPINEKGKYHD
jgi:hypothetical protein